MKDFLFRLGAGFRRLHREEEGVIIACSLAVFLFLYVLGCGVYALGTTIYEREALQNAADAAAYSAASIQADALSRMAMLNKALSYTYIQMSRKQMDCITAQWLCHLAKSYQQDRTDAENWTAVWFWPSLRIPVSWLDAIILVLQFLSANNDAFHGMPFSMRVYDPDKDGYCPLQKRINDTVAKGGAWFCGYGNTPDAIAVNGHPYPWSLIRQQVEEITTKNQIMELKKAIAQDKLTIIGINTELQNTHKAMCESLEQAIPAVLQRNLSSCFGKDALNECYYSAKIPEPEWNPYSASAQAQIGGGVGDTGATAGYYNVLVNTESDERRFLGMACTKDSGEVSKALPTFFSVMPQGDILEKARAMNVHLTTMGVDQWFVRGGTNYGGTPTYVRQDGAAGIQRVYWDSNGNVKDLRGGGPSLSGKGPTRGNHLFEGTLSIGQNPLAQIMEQITNGLLGNLLDFQASCHSWQGEERSCKYADDAQALVADWQWGGAKWICHVGSFKAYWNTLRNRRVYKRKKWEKHKVPYRPYECRRRHYAWPKFYVGGEAGISRHPRFQGNGDTYPDISLIWEHLREMAGFGEIRPEDSQRGYAGGAGLLEAGKGIKRWISLHTNGSQSVSYPAITRNDARECTISAAPDALFLRGYVRVYGDDRAICYPHVEQWTHPDGSQKNEEELAKEVDVYAGARAEPWILSERFFGPDGTITVAVAKRRRNPWMQLLGDAVESVRSLYSVGNPAGKNEATGTYMWALSSGRAAFRDPVDGTLQGSYRYLNKERQHDGLGDFEPGESGCVCDTAPARLERQWNLCVTEWEPTLVPVAMADAFRAVEDQFVANPQQETSGLAKLLYLDFVDDGTIQRDEGDEAGWLPLSGEGDPKKSDDFLRVAAPGSGDGPTFGPEDKADWPKTLWPRKIL